MHGTCGWLVALIFALPGPASGNVHEVDTFKLKELEKSYEVILLLFYSKKCVYSVQVLPIFDEVEQILHEVHANSSKVAVGKVNCKQEPELAARFGIGKYPTIKLIWHQGLGSKEYRRQRSTKGLVKFVFEELEDPINRFDSLDEISEPKDQKYMVFGYYENKSHVDYQTYRMAATFMKEYCQFHVNFNSSHVPNSLMFRREIDHTESQSVYTGSMSDPTEMFNWFKKNCVPSVRVLTFENAEEISEEGLAFVILFHRKDDLQSRKDFQRVVDTELTGFLSEVNFLAADGETFTNPISYLNRTDADLPFIAGDSFMHMYLFENYADLHEPGKLKAFIAHFLENDLRKYYLNYFVGDDLLQDEIETLQLRQEPPASKFKELFPSKKRYTFVRDEL